MPNLMITGAGRGIGLELVRRYAQGGWRVFAGIRDQNAVEALMRLEGDVTPLPLDVTDPASIAMLAERMRGVPFDMLINNAGIRGPYPVTFGAVDYAAFQQILAVNTLGPIRVAEAFLDHLRAGEMRRIVTLSSRQGAIGANTTGGDMLYRSSKAAVNAAMKTLSIDLAGDGFTVVVMHPGWVRTDMGGPTATLSIPESAAALLAVIDRLTPADSGRFFNQDGTELPW